MNERRSVLQPWVEGLTFMQQSVLISAVRGPDGIEKNHVAKSMLRWYRRCVLLMAFEGVAIENPWDPRGGSFTGPSLPVLGAASNSWPKLMHRVADDYVRQLDEIPHHFQLHFMHAAEILGYKHPDELIKGFWRTTYCKLVYDMHLEPEPEHAMDKRLGDSERDWRVAEVVTAERPS